MDINYSLSSVTFSSHFTMLIITIIDSKQAPTKIAHAADRDKLS